MGSKGLSAEREDEAYMDAQVDKQDVVLETGLVGTGKLYFSWSPKVALFSSFCL